MSLAVPELFTVFNNAIKFTSSIILVQFVLASPVIESWASHLLREMCNKMVVFRGPCELKFRVSNYPGRGSIRTVCLKKCLVTLIVSFISDIWKLICIKQLDTFVRSFKSV